MFTGIIEEVGTVATLERGASGARMSIRCSSVLSDAFEGSSIAVNGVCLTAVDLSTDTFAVDLAPETLDRSNLGDLSRGSPVNLERPLIANGRLNGHIVQGHVDGTGEIVGFDPLGDGNWRLSVRVPGNLDRYLVYKGSVALDGISLTVARIEGSTLEVAIIPHTYEQTTLRIARPGARINIECDIFAKYAEKWLGRLEAPAAKQQGR